MARQLKGKTAIVTGASSGIGRSIARHLGQEGVIVYLVGRSDERLNAVRQEVEDAGGNAVTFPADIRDLAQIDHVVERAISETGRLDIMVNNAGLGLGTTIADTDPENWREMFDVNVIALLKGAQTAINAMRRGGFEGHIVNIGSIAGREKGSGVYGASKAAVNYIGEALRQELEGDAIRVVQILPGSVVTNFGRNKPAELVEGIFNLKACGSKFETGDLLTDEMTKHAESQTRDVFLSADDIARAVVFSVEQPITVNVFEIDVRPQRLT